MSYLGSELKRHCLDCNSRRDGRSANLAGGRPPQARTMRSPESSLPLGPTWSRRSRRPGGRGNSKWSFRSAKGQRVALSKSMTLSKWLSKQTPKNKGGVSCRPIAEVRDKRCQTFVRCSSLKSLSISGNLVGSISNPPETRVGEELPPK